MMQPFDLKAKPVLVPAAWKTNWNYLENRRIHPELNFESLLCLSLAPDFVLDFGWHLSNDHVSYDLQINVGHFGRSDVVYFESFRSIEIAVSSLQNWLDRLAVDDEVKAKDADLQQRLAAIEAKLKCYFIPPDGECIEEILPQYMRKLIVQQASSWWQQGSADASLQYRYRTGVVHSQLIFLQRNPHGFHIEYHAPNSAVMRCISPHKKNATLSEVEIILGGAPWTLSANHFVSPHMAANITSEFIKQGSGQLPTIGQWESI
jgi:hypothetical protein